MVNTGLSCRNFEAFSVSQKFGAGRRGRAVRYSQAKEIGE